MSDRQHLLAGIRANVDDVAQYLIYADWLDELGDADDQQTAHCLRCAFDRALHFPTYDNLWIPEADFVRMNVGGGRKHDKKSRRMLMDVNEYEQWLKWRELELFRSRLLPMTERISVMPLWTRDDVFEIFSPLPLSAHGSLRGLMQNAAALMRYYPFTNWTVYDSTPRQRPNDPRYFFQFNTFAVFNHQAGQHYLPRELRPANINGDSAYFESNEEARKWLSDALIAYGLRELERLS